MKELTTDEVIAEIRKLPKLGKTIEIKSTSKLFDAPNTIRLTEKHYDIIIGIDNNNTCRLLISESSLAALRKLKRKLISK